MAAAVVMTLVCRMRPACDPRDVVAGELCDQSSVPAPRDSRFFYGFSLRVRAVDGFAGFRSVLRFLRLISV